MEHNRKSNIGRNGVGLKNPLKNGDCKPAVSHFVKFDDVIRPVLKDIVAKCDTCLTVDVFRCVLNSVFRDKLETVPVNLERYVILKAVWIFVYCDLCSVKVSSFKSLGKVNCLYDHINGKPHKKNVRVLEKHFSNDITNFDLTDTILLPHNLFSQLFTEEMSDQKKYFKAALHLDFKCNLCDHNFFFTNRIEQLRSAIYNHINEWEHIEKYIDTFPKPEYSLVMSRDAIHASLDMIYNRVKTFVSKELYEEVLFKIYCKELEQIPERNEQFIMVKLDLSLDCNLCQLKILKCGYSDLKFQVAMHIKGKRHRKNVRRFKARLQMNKYTELFADRSNRISDDMIQVSDVVVKGLCSVFYFQNYMNKIELFVSGHFVFCVYCNICNVIVTTTYSVKAFQVVVKSHIYSKTHMSLALKTIYRPEDNTNQ